MKHDLTISSVGDISFSTGLNEHSYDFTNWVSDEVLEYLTADIQIGNLECVFYPNKEMRPQGFNLSEQDSSISEILKSGFNVLTLANNHISDYYGYRGIEHTIKILKKNNIHHCGAGINLSEAQKLALIEVNGFKVGVLSRIHENSFENIKDHIATHDNPGAAPLNVKEVVEISRSAKLEYGLDVVVLAVHWGIQDIHNHTTEIHEIAQAIIEKSEVDIILGSHSHCIQGIDPIGNKVICYGQGNFYFYPQVLDDGILYDETQDTNRSSLVTKIKFNNDGLSVQAKVVKQDRRNVVVFIDRYKEEQILKKVFGVWKNDRIISIYFEYRLRAISLDINKLLGVFNNQVVRERFFILLFNPKKLFQKIWVTLFSSKLK